MGVLIGTLAFLGGIICVIGLLLAIGRKSRKRGWAISFIILSVLMLAAFGSSPQSSTTNASSVADTSQHSEQPDEAPATVSVHGKSLRAAIVDETYYAIESAHMTASIGGDQFTESTKPSGRFLILTVMVENASKKTRQISLSQSTLTDRDGNTYSTSSDGETALTMSGDKRSEFLLSEIQPHLSKELDLVYDVPATAKSFTLEIPHGMFSGGQNGKLDFSL